MLKEESNYQFRERMLQVHESNRRNQDLFPRENEFEIKAGMHLYISDQADKVLVNAAKDFTDYMSESMQTIIFVKSGKPSEQEQAIYVALAAQEAMDLGEYAVYRGYRMDVSEKGIRIYANDFRGAAQALFYLEDAMNIRQAPYITKGNVLRKPMYAPMMVHSGYGLDQYPDEHLNAIAHQGRDTILVFTEGINRCPSGYLDFHDLIDRAAGYGIDVYAYSYMKSEKHPEDEDAESFYESTYGELFRTCPDLKGVVMVGESVNFPSKDPHVATQMVSEDGIPSLKKTSFYYPCMDYVELVGLIKKIVRKYRADADIVFWTYNFGRAPEADRIKLIQALPQDISLLVTFEMSELYELDGVKEFTMDYTLSRAGYSKVFASEAAAAKERGIRLYAMTNTAGLTWDMGTVPYLPFPNQWIKRYQAMEEAKEKWNLQGLMESHHYGIYPSFISKLSQWCFTDSSDRKEPKELLTDILVGEFGRENVEAVKTALERWSEAAPCFIPCCEDQYGAFRVGPSYPLCLARRINIPSMPQAMFGNGIVTPWYCDEMAGRCSLNSQRIPKEIISLKKAKQFLEEGIVLLEKAPCKKESLLRLLNMGYFMVCYVQTGIHAKEWRLLQNKFYFYEEKQDIQRVLDDMEALLSAEKENVEQAMTYVQYDSRLGWEPSMEYMCDKARLEWKLRQLEYVQKEELKNCRISLAL